MKSKLAFAYKKWNHASSLECFQAFYSNDRAYSTKVFSTGTRLARFTESTGLTKTSKFIVSNGSAQFTQSSKSIGLPRTYSYRTSAGSSGKVSSNLSSEFEYRHMLHAFSPRALNITRNQYARPVLNSNGRSMARSYSKFTSGGDVEVEDLLVKHWNAFSIHNISLKYPNGWTFEEINSNTFQFYTRRNHTISCQILEKNSKVKSASQGAYLYFQEKQFQNSNNMQTGINNINGSEGDTFDAFELEFKTSDKSHWIVALDDERHNRVLVWHFETPIDDYDKSLFIMFLSTLNSRGVSRERVETIVEEPEFEDEIGYTTVDDDNTHNKNVNQDFDFDNSGKIFEYARKFGKYLKDVDLSSPYSQKNLSLFEKMIQDPEVAEKLLELNIKSEQLKNEDFSVLRDTEEYRNSEEIRNFTEEYLVNRHLALVKFANSNSVKMFVVKYILPILLK